jgi:hypothetical protein
MVKKGNIPWNKGAKGLQVAWNKGLTKEVDERVKKYSKTQEFNVVSEETKRKISKANKGKKRSEEIKRKMSEERKGKTHNGMFKKGQISLMKGKHHSPGTRKKMSLAKKGKKMSDAFKIKISESKKGQKLSELHKKRISSSNKGKKISEETRIKISCANRNIEDSKFDGFTTPKNRLIRLSVGYKQWRESVFKRDNHTCQYCNKHGGDMNAHHIKKFNNNKDLRFNINNGITLCKDCHKDTLHHEQDYEDYFNVLIMTKRQGFVNNLKKI